MYTTLVASQDEALCQLLLHCCLKDGRFEDAEIDRISEIFLKYGLQHNLNFKNEVLKYRTYVVSITNEQDYIDFLVFLIKPVNELALFSWCLELTLCDNNMSIDEELLLQKIAGALKISPQESEVINTLMIQRKVVLTNQIC